MQMDPRRFQNIPGVQKHKAKHAARDAVRRQFFDAPSQMPVPDEVRRQQERERSRRYYARHKDEVKKRKLQYSRDKAAEHQLLLQQLDALNAKVRDLDI